MAAKKEIFFHLGTGKTGTTYLQYRVYPYLKGIHYIQRTKFNRIKDIILNSDERRILISREFDRQMKVEVKKFAATFPDTTPIIVFRRQDSYIASQFRRFVKNGYQGSFNDFLDLDYDRGFFKKEHLTYMSIIQLLEDQFTQKPMVFFHHDLKQNPKAYIEEMANRMKTTVDVNSLNLTSKHKSYSEKQLKVIRKVGSWINMRKHRRFSNGLLHLFHRFFKAIIRYSVLYVGGLIPNSWVSKDPLLSQEDLDKVKTYFESDWLAVQEYAKQNASA